MLLGRTVVDGVSILDTPHIIPFKAKAWLDLSKKKQQGLKVDSKSINKHKKDVFRLAVLLREEQRIYVSSEVYKDINAFIESMENEEINLMDLGIHNLTQKDVLRLLEKIYIKV